MMQNILRAIHKRFHFPPTRRPDFSRVKKLDYDTYWKTRGFEIERTLRPREQMILEWIPSGSKILDVGCGNSRLPIALRDKGCEVTVADVSQTVLAGFEEHGIRTKKIDLENVQELMSVGDYDGIVMSEVLEHLRFPEDVLGALRDRTKRFYISIPNSAFYRYRLHLLFCGRFFTQWVFHPSEHLRFWSHIDFLDWLNAQGLIVERFQASNGFGRRFMRWLPNVFGHQICYEAYPRKS